MPLDFRAVVPMDGVSWSFVAFWVLVVGWGVVLAVYFRPRR